MPATKDRENGLRASFCIERSEVARNELVKRYTPLVDKHARRLSRRLSDQIDYEEIRSAAFEGLLSAIETYNSDRKVKFETYASRRITGAVLDWLRSIDPQSRSVRLFQRRRQEAMTLASCDEGRQVNGQEIAKRMGMPYPQYRRYESRLQSGKTVTLSRLATEDATGGGDSIEADIPCLNQPAPFERVERDLVAEFICRGLSETERRVVMLYYFEELTMAEAGVALGLSESRVSQIHRQILAKLRQKFSSVKTRYAIA